MKKIICIVTAVSLVTIFAFFAFGSTPVLSVTSAEAAPGENCTVQILLTDNPGIAGLFVTPEYNSSVLNLTDCINADVFDSMTAGKNILWDATANTLQDGCLCTLTFSVSTEAECGVYDIGLTVNSCTDIRQNNINLFVEKGTITVTNKKNPYKLKDSETVGTGTDGFLRVAVGTTVCDIQKLTDCTAVIADVDGIVMTDSGVLTTGCTVRLFSSAQTDCGSLVTFPVVVPGDINEDGIISAADARLALRRSVLLEDFPVGSVRYAAADADGQNDISAGDARLILRASVYLENPLLWIHRL